MPEQRRSELRAIVNGLLGREPRPPVGGYAEPPGSGDRRQMLALLICGAVIVILAIAVVKFDFLDIHFRDIPADVLNPTATPAP